MRSLILALALFQISESIEVHVAEVDVVVVDGAGKPVSGLTKADFELRVDGRVRDISNFYAAEGDRSPVTGDGAATPPSSVTSHPSPVTSSPSPVPPTHVVVFVDEERLDLRERNRVLASLGKFVESHLRPGVDVAVIVFNHGLKTRLQPTRDSAKLHAIIDEISRETPRLNETLSERRRIMQMIDDAVVENGRRGGLLSPDVIKQRMFVYGEHQITDLRQSLEAIELVMKRLRGATGRKVFVHVSSGLPLQPAVELYDYFERRLHQSISLDKVGLQQMSAYQYLVGAAQAAGVALYTIDASGLTGDEGSNLQTNSVDHLDSHLMRDNLHGPLQMLADETGGKAIINENDFDRAFGEIEAQYTTYYSLGFRADSDKATHKIDVRVKRPGLTVRSARAYRGRDADERARDGVEAQFDFPSNENPLGVAIALGRIENGNVPVRVAVAPEKLIVLEKKAHVRCYFQMRNADGGTSPLRAVDEEIAVSDESAPVVLRPIGMKLRPGKYTLSMAVRDLVSNDTSFVTRAIEVPALR
ncbi:MAG TPA: VWA domain-containing protein [Thermoanaerobaculia bacterium]|nr:VWA domain-containing protein [Thermoanaerobaculia bacterium]